MTREPCSGTVLSLLAVFFLILAPLHVLTQQYRLSVNVKDSLQLPVNNAFLRVSGQTFQSDSSGKLTNGGPFAITATLSSTIEGEDVLGCFRGFSLSSKQVIIR